MESEDAQPSSLFVSIMRKATETVKLSSACGNIPITSPLYVCLGLKTT